MPDQLTPGEGTADPGQESEHSDENRLRHRVAFLDGPATFAGRAAADASRGTATETNSASQPIVNDQVAVFMVMDTR